LEKRDSAKLFVYNTKTDEIFFDTFLNVDSYVEKGTILVKNTTRVLPVRLHLKKSTGGKIEVFLLVNELKPDDIYLKGIVDRKLSVGDSVFFEDGSFLTVHHQEEQFFYFTESFDRGLLEEKLFLYGSTPIPHYLEDKENTPSEEFLRKRYQTIFAQKGASVAAPTASLHFTEEVFEKLKKKNIETCDVVLNVGMGTFAPLEDNFFVEKRLHSESYEVEEFVWEKIKNAKREGKKICAVGTTTMRTLESLPLSFPEGIKVLRGETSIFIFPPYHKEFVADQMITNFHLPKTSLMLLVQAFLENKGAKRHITELYDIAIKNDFSFYSFGDSMLIL
jgi:S-adenosylmethionine:tRNA ribosyltransferase-isomerase